MSDKSKEKIEQLKLFLQEGIDKAVEMEIGEQLSSTLQLRRDKEHEDRWQTTFGNKTDLGIYRTVAEIIIRGIEKHEKEREGQLEAK